MSLYESFGVELFGGVGVVLVSHFLTKHVLEKGSKMKIESKLEMLTRENESLRKENDELRERMMMLSRGGMTDSQCKVYDYISSVFGVASERSATWWGWPEGSGGVGRSRHDVMLDRNVGRSIVVRLNFGVKMFEEFGSGMIESFGLTYVVDTSGSNEKKGYIRVKVNFPVEMGEVDFLSLRALIEFAYKQRGKF